MVAAFSTNLLFIPKRRISMYRNVAARVSLAASAAMCLLMAGAAMRADVIRGGQPPTVAFATRHGKSASLRITGPPGWRAAPNRDPTGTSACPVTPDHDSAVQRQFACRSPRR
jgi:hypothetical protein